MRGSDKVAGKQSNPLDNEFDRVMGLFSCTMALFQKPPNQNPSLWMPEGCFVDESISALFLRWPCCVGTNIGTPCPVISEIDSWWQARLYMASGQGSHNRIISHSHNRFLVMIIRNPIDPGTSMPDIGMITNKKSHIMEESSCIVSKCSQDKWIKARMCQSLPPSIFIATGSWSLHR